MSSPIRAVIYARYSTDLQRDASIDDQIRACDAYAKRQGLDVVETYSDRATSGASLMRSGIQKLMRDAQSRQFDIVITHALDRLSRNQADIAGLYQKLQFAGVMIETISEGSIDEIHIGLKGTMNALYLKDLGKKTREGLRGRASAGKSAGGKTYGYDVVTRRAQTGEPVHGERAINQSEAAIVRRIFRDYANGVSPKKIAEALNREQVPAPRGKHWGASTIHGNRERGTGILNNELYIGRLVWNRLTYIKDPETGKRVSRPNRQEDLTITNVPDLRIVNQGVWEAAKARQGTLKSKGTGTAVWDRRRPRTLFSGLMRCGCCGSGFSKVQKDAFGCSAARNKGNAVCTNMLTIKQRDLEDRVLEALTNNLMEPEAVRIFCEEYTAERNRLANSAASDRKTKEAELARVKNDHAKLIDAIVAGVPADQVKDRMNDLDRRRKALEHELASIEAPEPVLFHPSMAARYREQITMLIAGLSEADQMLGSKEALRDLIEKIVLTPSQDGAGLDIDLYGAIAGLLHLATGVSSANSKKASPGESEAFDILDKTVLVAGAGFEPAAFRL
ncbi:recombinase family protein [Martelella radicis]|uniref:recombinase family protein n=1 Tax=Martelella radicis TaxID=1397476 RepID=UPI0016090194|nr:recombinase family protein [Martelella radicis]